jgi:hypothetical protein
MMAVEDNLLIIPATLTPTGWGIMQIRSDLTAVSPCCEATVTRMAGRYRRCADCERGAEAPTDDGWWTIATTGNGLERWISEWTGIPEEQIKVDIR